MSGIAVLLFGLSSLSNTPGFDNLPKQFVVETVVADLSDPVNIVSLPDGRMMILEKAGRVKLFDPTDNIVSPKIILSISAIQTTGERGLASIALDPNFTNNGHFYLYYTQLGNDNRNRLSRFTFDFSTEIADKETLVWEDNDPSTDCCHFGGGLDFGPDGMLYLATGEEFDAPQAQDLTRAGGKIIRLDVRRLDSGGPWVRGEQNLHLIPSDNPVEIMDGAGPNLDEIWAYGLRNPYRAHWDLVKQRFYIGDVGGNVQAVAKEELQIGRKGANYGWPLCEGECGNPAYDDPLHFYGHQGKSPVGGAITAGVIYRGKLFPEEYNETFFFADYAVGFIRYLTFNADGSVNSVNNFADNAGAIVAIELGADDALYAVDYVYGKVIKISYDSGNQRPKILTASPSVTKGEAPLIVEFSAIADDVEDDTLSYQWLFGDEAKASGRSVSHTYTEPGLYNAQVTVSDTEGSGSSDVIPIQVGSPPVAIIDSPSHGDTFIAGQVIPFSASHEGNESNGPYVYEWDIKFFHNSHIHPALASRESSGQLVVNDTGHNYHDDTGFEFTLTVTDSRGLTSTAVVRNYPQKNNVEFATSPIDIPITLDGLPVPTPVKYDTLINFNHVVSVPLKLCVEDNEYEFTGWSNGAARTQVFQVPEGDSSLTANFENLGPCSFIPTNGLVAHFDSTLGVETSGDIARDGRNPVTRWRDLSGNNNHLTSVSGNPGLLPGAFNGNPVVDFDGLDDALRRNVDIAAFPLGDSDRTVFMLANYQGPGAGGFSYGKRLRNRAFGLQTSSMGLLEINAFSDKHDFESSETGTGAGWLIQSAILDASTLTHYRNNRVIDVQQNDYATESGPMLIGADVNKLTHLDMQVAALLVYDRALSEEERVEVIEYLKQKYFTLDGNPIPVANNDNILIGNGDRVIIDVLANDVDDDQLDIGSVQITQPPGVGTAKVDSNTGTIIYTHDGISVKDSFIYTVRDAGGARSNQATVSVFLSDPGNLESDGLVAHFESDKGVLQKDGVVTGWQDQSGQGNDLLALGDVTMQPMDFAAQSVLALDGDGDLLKRAGQINGFPVGNESRTLYMVVRYSSPGVGGFAWGEPQPNKLFALGLDASKNGKLAVQGFGSDNAYLARTDGVDTGWMVQSAIVNDNVLRHFKNGTLIDITRHLFETANRQIVLGAELDGDTQVEMEVGAVLLYDRALSVTEQHRVQNYLQVKYGVAVSNYLAPGARQKVSMNSGDSESVESSLASDDALSSTRLTRVWKALLP